MPSKPLLVNFDYHGTLIKEVLFDKSTEELAYQLRHDEDVLGRLWALSQLKEHWNTAAGGSKEQIAAEIANAITHDSFWGVRNDAAAAALNMSTPVIREALIAGTKDSNARVRAKAIASLGESHDASLAGLYLGLLNDRSYAVIKAAAVALGSTRNKDAYGVLVKLMDVPSWRDNIRASALSGLAETGDKRALEFGLKYAEPGNSIQVRTAALRLIGKIGGNDSAAFDRLAKRVTSAFQAGEYNLAVAAGEALVALGDPKGLAVLEQLNADPTITGRLKTRLGDYAEKLQKSVAGRPTGGAHPNE